MDDGGEVLAGGGVPGDVCQKKVPRKSIIKVIDHGEWTVLPEMNGRVSVGQ